MGEMLDRAERALLARWTVSPGIETELVRAVIAAIREPTDAVLRAGECEVFEHEAREEPWQLSVTKDGWQAMIDKILGVIQELIEFLDEMADETAKEDLPVAETWRTQLAGNIFIAVASVAAGALYWWCK